MSEAFHQGGWGMYPTTIVGLILIILAGRYALSPTRARLPLLIAMQVLTLLVGSLGFIAGLIRSTTATGDLPNPTNVVLVGFGESLNNVAYAVCMVVVAMLGICIGLARQRSATSGSLVDPLRG